MSKVDNETLQDKDFVDGEKKESQRRKKKRKTIGEEGSRKQTAIGFLLMLALSLVFFLPKELKNWWNLWNEPETVTILKPVGDEKNVSEVVGFKVSVKEKADAEEVVEELLKDLSGEYGVWIENLKTEEGFSINKSKSFGAASVSKMPVLIKYYQQVDAGEIDPETEYVLKEADRWEYGTGSMQNQPVGTEYTYQEVAELVAKQSDNMGAQLLTKWVSKKMPEEMTLAGAGEIFIDLYKNNLLSEQSRELLFDSLTDTVNEDRITAGVPSGTRVVHKFGSEEGIVNDCGIVFGKDPYMICLMTTGVNDGQALEVLPKISRVVWEWMGK